MSEFRMIPAKTKVWLISIQENVFFDNDIPVKITNRIIGEDDYVYGTLQLLLFNIPGMIPTVLDKVNGDVGFSLKETIEWEIPNPQFLELTYKNDE